MKEVSVTLYEVTAEEITKLADGTAVLVHDSLYRRNEIKHKGKNKFPAVKRFVYLLFEAPEGSIEQ